MAVAGATQAPRQGCDMDARDDIQEDDIQEIGLWYALYRLEARHWYDVDFNGGASAHDLYCEDGLFSVGPNRFEGRDGIKNFYQWRRSRGENTVRHIISNPLLLKQEARGATLGGLITIHRAKGGHPNPDGNIPSLIADFTSTCALGADGIWRYASHVLAPVFVGNDLPLSLAIDPRFLASRDWERVGSER